jgi:hypothetical protein
VHLSAAAATGSIDDGFAWTGAIIKAPTHANASNLQTWFRRCPPVQKVAMPQGGEASCSPDGPTSRGQHRSIGSDADC